MADRKPLTSEEISAIVDGFEPIDVEEMEIIASLTPVRMGKTYTEPAYYGWLC